MKKGTVLVSVLIHGGVALALLTASQHRASGKSFFVQMQEAKKKELKEKAKAEPPKPKVAKVDRSHENKPAPAPKAAPVNEAPVPVAKAAVAPIAMDMAMSNEDIGDAVAIPVARPAQAAAPTKVASLEAEPRKRRIHELGPGGPSTEERCTEEPSKPEPVFKTEIEYTAAARAEGIEGKLKLRVSVGADGAVLAVDVLASVSPELDAAAIAAVKRWRFRPAMACGKPVAGGTYVLARRFELGD
jgi:protein TonB